MCVSSAVLIGIGVLRVDEVAEEFSAGKSDVGWSSEAFWVFNNWKRGE